MVLGKDALLNYQQKPVPFNVEAMDGQTVLLRQLTAGERTEFFAISDPNGANKDDPFAVEKMVSFALADKNGQRLISTDEAQSLASLPLKAMNDIIKEFTRINRLSVEAMEEIKGNSGPGQSADS